MYDQPGKHVRSRLRKREELLASEIDPYPVAAYSPTHTLTQVVADAATLERKASAIRVAGRVVARRRMGRVVFFDLLDDGTRLQVFLLRPGVAAADWRTMELVDLGDFIGIDGTVVHTRTGELSIQAGSVAMLGKASHPIPLPKARHAVAFDMISDRGTLRRQRHVDLVCNPTSREVLVKRSRILRGIRRYLDEEGFLEVETPILGRAYGGASARPFVTRLNAFDEDMYLRISPECALKRLLCGGFNKVYELGKSFRNEGVDSSHSPEFTMVEWYEAYSDYLEQMVRFETLVGRLCDEIHGTTRIIYRGRDLDLTPPWRRLPMLDGLREIANVDLTRADDSSIAEIFAVHHPHGEAALPSPFSWGAAVVSLFEALVEPRLWDPVFVMDHPVEISPLTKRHRLDGRLVERFEPIVAGMEVGNAYSELNDPVEQYERLASQQLERESSYDLDEDFMLAIAHGMPPAGGTGLGVDRIVMILTDVDVIRETVALPLVSRRG